MKPKNYTKGQLLVMMEMFSQFLVMAKSPCIGVVKSGKITRFEDKI
jgi:hypothetical protein